LLRVARLHAAELHGLVWVRQGDAANPPADEQEPGLQFIHSLQREIAAPVASVMDNFTEVEHTGIAHWQFGYDPTRLNEIEIETALEGDCIRVRTTGPQRPLLPTTRLGFGVPNGMQLVCEWETRFTPARSTWRWHWRNPRTGAATGRRFKAVAYFNPLPGDRTQLLTFYFWSGAAIDRLGFAAVAKPLLRLATSYEVSLDSALIEGLSDSGRGIPPTGASRFDKALLEQRRRLGK
jgi:phenylpropionate dioxygenase-like ring-hydroxylating dioxygenase large terminal subunit